MVRYLKEVKGDTIQKYLDIKASMATKGDGPRAGTSELPAPGPEPVAKAPVATPRPEADHKPLDEAASNTFGAASAMSTMTSCKAKRLTTAAQDCSALSRTPSL